MSTPIKAPVIAIVSHELNAPVRAMFERVAREAPADHEVRFILSTNNPDPDLAGLDPSCVDHITKAAIFAPAYPAKCNDTDWDMAGNLDLVFLEFRRRHPHPTAYWFIEYDVHWEGAWNVFLDHFRDSRADVLAATIIRIQDHPTKYHIGSYPPQVVPPGMPWADDRILKAFLPACRLSPGALDALDAAYRAGLGGHYEINVPSIPSQHDMLIEDFGGNGPFVRPENRDRFYFARGSNYSHSPGTFVFRPAMRPLRRLNTLWHPVKPEGISVWHPLQIGGNPLKTIVERAKPLIWQAAIRLWFATRWRPFRPAQASTQASPQARPAVAADASAQTQRSRA